MSRILSAPKTTKPRTTPFQAAHCVQYGLKIVERHPQKQDVTGVRCRFCLHIQHSDLLFAYRHEPTLRTALEGCDDQTSFENGWKIVSDETRKFDILREFCGGIATVFPNTGTVESDFSVLGWEKDEYRQSLTDLSLEGIMQCKQFELLADLTYREC